MKAQMEMMGLVIIVILITVGLLFMATFALKDSKQKNIFTRKGLASSTLSSVLKATVVEPCGEYVGSEDLPQLGEDILEDCALQYREYYDNPSDATNTNPYGYSQYRCEGKHSCQFFQDKVGELLGSTLKEWGKKYELKATLLQGQDKATIITIKNEGCPGERDSSGLFPIQTDAGLLETQLFVCD